MEKVRREKLQTQISDLRQTFNQQLAECDDEYKLNQKEKKSREAMVGTFDPDLKDQRALNRGFVSIQ